MRSRVITPSLVVIMLACASAAPACFATDMTPGVQNESTSEADFQQWLATFRSNATTKGRVDLFYAFSCKPHFRGISALQNLPESSQRRLQRRLEVRVV